MISFDEKILPHAENLRIATKFLFLNNIYIDKILQSIFNSKF